MSTLFPASLDVFTNPTASSNMNDPAVAHHTQHANANDAIRAVETAIGITGSTDANSINYKLSALQARTGVTVSNLLKTANYAIGAQDYFIRVDASAAEVEITLPPVLISVGRVYIVKKVDASANSVVVKTTGAELIDSFLTQPLLLQHDKITVVSNGTSWNII